MTGQDVIVSSNDPAHLALTARTALEYAERAYAEGRFNDAERLIEAAHFVYDAACARASPGAVDGLSVPSDISLVE